MAINLGFDGRFAISALDLRISCGQMGGYDFGRGYDAGSFIFKGTSMRRLIGMIA
jgi:hypothetical protein